MVGIGIVGIGFMGMIHFLAARPLAGGRVVALCSRDPKKRAGDWTDIQGNFGPRGGLGLHAHAKGAAVPRQGAEHQVELVVCVRGGQDERAALVADGQRQRVGGTCPCGTEQDHEHEGGEQLVRASAGSL